MHPLLWLSHWIDRLVAGFVPLDLSVAFDSEEIFDDLRFGR